jgi:hypothetical protein
VGSLARLLLVGGPFDGHEAAGLPPDTGAPAQIVWSGWSPHGFTAWLYEWHGETTMEGAFTDALVYRPTGLRLTPDDIPPLIAQDAETWADGAALLISLTGPVRRGGMKWGDRWTVP